MLRYRNQSREIIPLPGRPDLMPNQDLELERAPSEGSDIHPVLTSLVRSGRLIEIGSLGPLRGAPSLEPEVPRDWSETYPRHRIMAMGLGEAWGVAHLLGIEKHKEMDLEGLLEAIVLSIHGE